MNKPKPPVAIPTLKRSEDEIDLGAYWAAIAERKWLVAVVTILVLSVAVLYILVAAPVYYADAMLQLEAQRTTVNALDDISKLLLTENEEALAELEIIRSRHVIGQVVEKLNLDIQVEPRYFPFIGAAIARYYEKDMDADTGELREPVGGLSQFAWGGERIEIAHLAVSPVYENQGLTLIAGENNQYQLYETEDNLLLEGVVNKRAVTKAKEKTTSPLVNIVVAELHARPGTEFIITKQSHSLTVLELQEQLKAVEKSRESGILQLGVEGTDPYKISQMLNTLGQVYVQQNVERKQQKAEKMLDFVNHQLPTLKANLEAAEAKLSVHHKKYGSVNIELETHALLGQLAELEKRISSLELTQVDYKLQYTRKNRYLISLEKQLNQLKKERTALNKRINKLPKAEINLTKIMRDVTIASEVYSLLLNKAQELNIAKAGMIGNVYIVDQATVPVEPVKPKKPLIIGGALISGLFLGIFFALLRKSMHATINSPKIIERHLNLPICAIVPHSEKQLKLTKFLKKKKPASMFKTLATHFPQDFAVESLRSLRTNLQFALIDADRPVIVVSSPIPDAGKAFITVNMGCLFANVGKQVLLINGDMRYGHLHKVLMEGLSPGLSEVINGEYELEAAIRELSGDVEGKEFNISILPAGTRPPNPSELLMHKRFQDLLDTVSKQYDIVIIDTPPVIAVTDAAIIGCLAGGTNLLVVRAGQQLIEEVERSLKRFEQASAKMTGVIFNDVSPRSGIGKQNLYLK
jgi:tyrosine-protein kinase Etk/Wzc